MLASLAALLLLVPAAGSGQITLTVGEPTVFSQVSEYTFWTYPVTATWSVSCAQFAPDTFDSSVSIGWLGEGGEVDGHWWSGLVKLPSATGSYHDDIDPGRRLQASFQVLGECSLDVTSNVVSLPPRLGGVYPLFALDVPSMPRCFVPGTAIHPQVMVQMLLNQGETLELHFNGAGLADHVETFDKARWDDAQNDLYTVTTTTEGTVDIWAVHSTAGVSNHIKLYSRADGCEQGERGPTGTDDENPQTPSGGGGGSSGCSSATGAANATGAIFIALLGAGLSRRRRR